MEGCKEVLGEVAGLKAQLKCARQCALPVLEVGELAVCSSLLQYCMQYLADRVLDAIKPSSLAIMGKPQKCSDRYHFGGVDQADRDPQSEVSLRIGIPYRDYICAHI